MRVALGISWLVVLAAGLVAARPARDSAEIFAITPETGPAGTEVRIKGRGLKGTEHVLFAVGGTAKTARFRVISDEELEVITPEYYRPGAAATVAVLGPTGLVVAMPAAVQTIRVVTGGTNGTEPGAGFYHVLKGGRVRTAESVALIERGGVVDRSRAPAMHLVKDGGVLMEFSNANGIVFHEQGAVLGREMINPRHTVAQRFFHVQRITASPGVGPFIYQGVPRPDVARIPAKKPGIEAVVPPAAGAGDIISLTGQGFARTTEVLLIGVFGHSQSAGFRIVSDRQLNVEVPDQGVVTGTQVLMVVTTEGLTVTLPRGGIVRLGQIPALPGAQIPMTGILWLGNGEVLENYVGSQMVFIAPGGTFASFASGGTFFVQRDGAVVADRGARAGSFGIAGGLGVRVGSRMSVGASHVFYEPGAILPEELKKAPVGRETPAIVPSFFDRQFEILRGPLFRP